MSSARTIVFPPQGSDVNSSEGNPVTWLGRRTFLRGSVAAALTASALAGTGVAAQPAAAASTGLKVGAGKAAIGIPSSLLPLDTFTVVHDALYVRILLLENGANRVALAVLDLTSISEEAITQMRAIINKAAGVATKDIVVTVTHTFSAPHVGPTTGKSAAEVAKANTFLTQILTATTTAIAAAVKGLQPARVGYGAGKCDVNVNRNVLTADGWWLGTGESEPSDKSVGVARFDDPKGNPIAVLANYDVQSSVMMESVMADGGLPITADLAGATVAHVEKQYGSGVVGFFLVGACGDQAPAFRSKRYTIDKDKKWSQVDAHDAGWLLLALQGERLGTEVVRVSETIKATVGASAATLRLVTDSVVVNAVTQGHSEKPTKSYTFTPNGTAKAPIWVLQVGQGVFAGVEPELSTNTALSIKNHSPFQHTFVMSMLEGGSKNMSEATNYDRITYQAVDSSYAKGSAETVAAKIGSILRSLRS